MSLGEKVDETVFDAGVGGREGREVEDEGAPGQAGGARPAVRDSEQDGALEVLLERFGRGPGGLAEGDAEAGGEAAGASVSCGESVEMWSKARIQL
jgi:hypothetical protein